MSHPKFFVVIILLSTLLTSCALHMPLVSDPTTGNFPASKKVPDHGIRVNVKTTGLPEYSFLNIRPNLHSSYPRVREETKILLHDAFSQIGFHKIVNKSDLISIAENALPNEKSYYLYNIDFLNKVSKKVGRFLVAEATTSFEYPMHFFRISLIDPYIGEIVFMAEIETVVYFNYPKELYYPVLNEVKKWYEKQEFIRLKHSSKVAQVK